MFLQAVLSLILAQGAIALNCNRICGEEIRTVKPGEIANLTSPNWPKTHACWFTDCKWIFKSTDGSPVTISFPNEYWDIERGKDYVTIKENGKVLEKCSEKCNDVSGKVLYIKAHLHGRDPYNGFLAYIQVVSSSTNVATTTTATDSLTTSTSTTTTPEPTTTSTTAAPTTSTTATSTTTTPEPTTTSTTTTPAPATTTTVKLTTPPAPTASRGQCVTCLDWKKAGRPDGVYQLHLWDDAAQTHRAVNAVCQRGQTVFLQRVDGKVAFDRKWNDYKSGFGDFSVGGNYWFGNDNIHLLTSVCAARRLRIDVKVCSGETAYETYSNFEIGDESSKYSASVSGAAGTAGDGMNYGLKYGVGMDYDMAVDGMSFSTVDQDNDKAPGRSCANMFGSG